MKVFKDGLKKIGIWFKNNILYFIIFILFLVGFFMFITQQSMIFVLKNDLNDLNIQHQNTLELVKEELNNKIKYQDNALNARMDILDSAIKPDQKRRKLIASVRNAITENTTRSIDIRTLNRIAISVIDYSYLYNLTISQVLAQIKTESDFNHKASSNAGALGLMQIIPRTLKEISINMGGVRLNAWNVDNNIKAGCFYMAEQMHRFGSFEEALRAYNWGPHRLTKYNAGEISAVPIETQNYVPLVLNSLNKFETYGLE